MAKILRREVERARWIACTCDATFTSGAFAKATEYKPFDLWVMHARSDSAHMIEDYSDRNPYSDAVVAERERSYAFYRMVSGGLGR